MTKLLQFKRYPTNVLNTKTGAAGELIVDTNNHTLTVHDGITPGGIRLALENNVDTSQNTRITAIEAVDVQQNNNIVIVQGGLNSANVFTQASFTKANNALPLSGGTITGNTIFTKDVSITGNTTFANVNVGTVGSHTGLLIKGLGKEPVFGYKSMLDIVQDNSNPWGFTVRNAQASANSGTTFYVDADGASYIGAGNQSGGYGDFVIFQSNFNGDPGYLRLVDPADGVGTGSEIILQSGKVKIFNTDKNWTFNADGSTDFPTNGDVSISGNLTVTGTTTTISVKQLEIDDPLIYLAANNYTSDTFDIGFIGHYNATGNAHTGLIRDPDTKEYYFFQGYTPEVDANNNINITHASFKTANVNANTFKGNLISTTAFVNYGPSNTPTDINTIVLAQSMIA